MDMQGNERMKLTAFLRNEDGIMAVVFAMLLPVFIVIAALAIDMGYSYWKRNTLQVASSVSALAGAGFVMDDATVTRSGNWEYDNVDTNPQDGVPDNFDSDSDGVADGALVALEANDYSNLNIDQAENVLAVVDVMAGNWNAATRIFTSAGKWVGTWDDPGSLTFDDSQPREYDADTGEWTDVIDPVEPFDAVMAYTRRADDGPNFNPLPLFLAAAVGMPQLNINTAAIAAIAPQIGEPVACILALDPGAEDALHIFGKAELHAEDCDIVVNSCDDKAIWFNGTPDIYVAIEDGVKGGVIASCGGYQENGPVTVVGEMVLKDPAVVQDDPVLLTAPNLANYIPECTYTDFTWKNGDPPLQPGVYCGGIKGTSVGEMVFCGQETTADCPGGTLTGDGLYIIKDGPLEIAGGAGVTARGVTFYLTDEAGGPYSLVDFKGTSSSFLDMSASTEGDYTGVLFWHDCGGTTEECAGLTHNLRGTPGYGMEGLLYFPDSHVYIRGTADAAGGSSECLMLIANTIEMNGTSGLTVNNACSNFGGLDDIFIADLRLMLVN